MKRKTVIIVSIVALCLARAVVLFRKPPPLDLSHDESPFPSIVMPPKSVMGDIYMDGGSIVVTVTDQTGARYELTFPIAYEKIGAPYPTAFYGNIKDRKMIPFKNPERAKQIAIRLLRAHGTSPPNLDPADDYDYDGTANAIRSLSNPTYIKAYRFADKAKNQMKNLFQ